MTMLQNLIVALIVAWAVWVAASRLLPRPLRAALRKYAARLAGEGWRGWRHRRGGLAQDHTALKQRFVSGKAGRWYRSAAGFIYHKPLHRQQAWALRESTAVMRGKLGEVTGKRTLHQCHIRSASPPGARPQVYEWSCTSR
jgi:hypothetical protein